MKWNRFTCVFSPSRKAWATLCLRNVPKSRPFFDSSRGHSSQSFKNRRYRVADIFCYGTQKITNTLNNDIDLSLAAIGDRS
ncbi:hypothetical protein J4Q44_G00106500 [Coregonus suidteri]|uniref:Uncharacterized protein n=1 Tax=Coregonus suidteri TaxID=861788 RepID=A0AAN8LZY3_9TELE